MSVRTSVLALVLGLLGGGSPRLLAAVAPPSLSELGEAKLRAARAAYEAAHKAFPAGKGDPEKVYLWSRRWMEAQRDRAAKKADQAAALRAHRDRMKDLRKAAEARYHTGLLEHAGVLGVDFYIAEAELWLAEAQAR